MTEILYIVIPCYNEQEVLAETSRRVADKLEALKNAGKIARESRILLVDDGSRDNTWQMIEVLYQERPKIFSGLKLSGNRGHQNALMAGLMTAKDRCDIAVSMDADLQDDIGAIDSFLEKRGEGCDIVYGVRSNREKDSAFKRITAQCFYRFMTLLGVNIICNHADYRLMSRRALEALAGHREVNLFLRGVIPLLGFKSDKVFYIRDKRFAGESKYPLRKMLSFAWNGISSFSVKPIRFVTALGFAVSFMSVILILYSFYQRFFG
ncbi:MAG: glycosyltransferase family 2 protein, partial [Oscillospiraceae bacterium]|nr:glycosyltransferase family 2 protein [Oscillospiraceae bacterium]